MGEADSTKLPYMRHLFRCNRLRGRSVAGGGLVHAYLDYLRERSLSISVSTRCQTVSELLPEKAGVTVRPLFCYGCDIFQKHPFSKAKQECHQRSGIQVPCGKGSGRPLFFDCLLLCDRRLPRIRRAISTYALVTPPGTDHDLVHHPSTTRWRNTHPWSIVGGPIQALQPATPASMRAPFEQTVQHATFSRE